jgi:hypothetical protein
MVRVVFPAWLAGAKLGISPADVPEKLVDPIWSGVLWQGSANAFLMEIPDAARVLVTQDGFTLSPLVGIEMQRLAPVLRRTPLAALCWLNGYYACQGVALAGPDGAVAILGGAGVGKSSLAALLMKQGLRLLCDDLVPLARSADGAVQVMPVWPELVLWPSTTNAIFSSGIPSWLVRRQGDLFDVPYWNVAGERFMANPIPLKRVYTLKRIAKNGEMEAQLTGGLQGFITGEGGLEPYHRVVAYALRTQGLALQFYGSVVGRMPIEIFKLPMTDLSELDDVAYQIMTGCGWGGDG